MRHLEKVNLEFTRVNCHDFIRKEGGPVQWKWTVLNVEESRWTVDWKRSFMKMNGPWETVFVWIMFSVEIPRDHFLNPRQLSLKKYYFWGPFTSMVENFYRMRQWTVHVEYGRQKEPRSQNYFGVHLWHNFSVGANVVHGDYPFRSNVWTPINFTVI